MLRGHRLLLANREEPPYLRLGYLGWHYEYRSLRRNHKPLWLSAPGSEALHSAAFIQPVECKLKRLCHIDATGDPHQLLAQLVGNAIPIITVFDC